MDAKLPPVPVELDRNGIARDAGFRPRDHSLFAQHPIDQRGFASVRAADDRDFQRRIGIGIFVLASILFVALNQR